MSDDEVTDILQHSINIRGALLILDRSRVPWQQISAPSEQADTLVIAGRRVVNV
jgi:hypothetical protein